MKELIYFPENELKPTGGPRGYLYNLNKGLEEIGEKSIFFLPPQKKTSNKNKIKEWIPYRLLQLKNAIRFSNLDKEKDPVMVDFTLYISTGRMIYTGVGSSWKNIMERLY